MGESVAEATITKFLVSPGDKVGVDDALVEIATDKVDSEVPAPEEGVLVDWLVAEGDVVAVGQVIARYQLEDGSGNEDAPTVEPAVAPVEQPSEVKSAPQPEATNALELAPVVAPPDATHTTNTPAVISAVSAPLDRMPPRLGEGGRFYSPLVRSIAQSEGVTVAELDAISGTGQEGRVTKKDVFHFLNHRGSTGMTSAPSNQPSATAIPLSASLNGEDEIIEMDRMRKLIAHHMVQSVQTSPHVTSFVEADMTKIVRWREANKATFLAAHGSKLTYTPMIAEAIVKAIRDFPGVNASVDGDRIIIKKQINLGMAAALPSGNLIVPVIKNADQFSLVGLAKQVNDLADRARLGKLGPDDVAGGTYTMSNVGTFGNVMGTPIINQPQVAILAIGAIRKKPAVIETPEGDAIAVRHMMFLSHSYDHRVVDGMLGGSFVRRVADYLEGFDPTRSVM